MNFRAGLAGLLSGLFWVSAYGCGPAAQSGVIGTVNLGDNFVAADLQLDEEFFFCRIQPEVLTKYSCASGKSSEHGGCHDSRSALRLIDTKAASPCDKGGRIVRSIPNDYMSNLEAVRFFVQSDPLTSPLYVRPVNKASHPRQIFDEQSTAAGLIVDWISAGAN